MASQPVRTGFLSLLFLSLLGFACGWPSIVRASDTAKIREPVVSGQFYTDSPVLLKKQIEQFLNQSKSSHRANAKAIIVPHAGYVYSGPVAAEAYRAIRGQTYDDVIVLGFSHRTPLDGVFVDGAAAYKTPLGEVPVNQDLAEQIRDFHPALRSTPKGDFAEHSVEVQIPFLQETLKNLRIVPVYMGDQSLAVCQILADALADAIRGRNVLVVTSTDLSHYHPDNVAREKDKRLISYLEDGDIQTLEKTCNRGPAEACGKGPLLVTLMLREKLGWSKPVLLKYGNSGDTSGNKTQVVGYAALLMKQAAPVTASVSPDEKGVAYASELSPGTAALSSAEKEKLLHYSRAYLNAFFDRSPSEPALEVNSPVLNEKRGIFVTLKRNGNLRGCIGQIYATEPVRTNLKKMTLAAATQDPRFRPVTKEELQELEIHISLLTLPAPVPSYEDIRLGTDGIVVQQGFKNGVFLPEVATETGWDKKTFFVHCAVDKAGIPARDLDKARIFTFQTDSFGEHDF